MMKKVILACVFVLSLIATGSYGIGGPAGDGTSGPSNPGGTPGPEEVCITCYDFFGNPRGTVCCPERFFGGRGYNWILCNGTKTHC